MKGLLGWLIAHARWAVTAVAMVSVGLGLAAMRLSLEFHAGDLLPQGHPFIAVHNRYHRYLERTPVVGASFSLVDLLKGMGAALPRARGEVGRDPDYRARHPDDVLHLLGLGLPQH